MDRKEVIGSGKKNSSPSCSSNSSAYSPPSEAALSWLQEEERPIKTASEFLKELNQSPINQVLRPDAQRKLTSSEFLEFLRNQGPEAPNASRSDGNYQSSSSRSPNIHNERNYNYQTVAIDQCDITSSVDYGSRDYYCPSAHTSDTPYTHKENELDDLYNKTCTDTRGNWWEGSFHY